MNDDNKKIQNQMKKEGILNMFNEIMNYDWDAFCAKMKKKFDERMKENGQEWCKKCEGTGFYEFEGLGSCICDVCYGEVVVKIGKETV